MEVEKTIKQDLINALKNKEEEQISVLRLIKSAITNKEIEKRSKSKESSELSEEEIIEVLASEAKRRKESIEAFKKGNRLDLVEKEKRELEIIQKYLPSQLSPEEIKKEVKKAIEEIKPGGPSDFGKVMGILSQRLKGRADGKTIADILRKELEK